MHKSSVLNYVFLPQTRLRQTKTFIFLFPVPASGYFLTLILHNLSNSSRFPELCNSHNFSSQPYKYVKVKVAQLCPIFATPWTIQSMEFSRPEYWSGQLFPSPGDLPNSGIAPRSPTLQADSLPAEPPGKPLDINRDRDRQR